jgi:hypothetical protein
VLSEADADLVARERALPGLPVLLDADAFAELLRGLSPAFARASIQATYVRYKPGTRCLVAFEVRGPDTPPCVYATAYEPGRWAARRAAADARGLRPATSAIDARAVLVSLFPADARLRALASLGDPARSAPLLRKLAPAWPSLHGVQVSTLAYKPERRYVGLLRGDGSRAVIKLYADAAFARARAAVVTPLLSDLLATPRCIGRSRRHRAMVLEWLPGDRLSDWLASDAVPVDDVRRAGLALAELHRQLRGDRSRIPCTAPGLALRRARRRGAVARAGRSRRAARRRTAAALAEPAPVQPIHGDFYGGQVLAGPGPIGILDLDRVCAGDPAADVGNFVAHLEYAAVDGSADGGCAPSLPPAPSWRPIRRPRRPAAAAGARPDRRRAAAARAAPFRTRAADWASRMTRDPGPRRGAAVATAATAARVVYVPRAVAPRTTCWQTRPWGCPRRRSTRPRRRGGWRGCRRGVRRADWRSARYGSSATSRAAAASSNTTSSWRASPARRRA